MNSNWFKLFMRFNRVRYGKNLLLNGIPIIYCVRGASIQLGNDCTINSSFMSNLIGLYCRSIIIARRSGAKILIGNNVHMSATTIYAREGITIGDNTAIGGNCKILDNDFHPSNWEERSSIKSGHGGESELIPSKPISIGKDCFIGCNCLILKGSEIGDRCVIGAGAVVSGTFEDDCVIAGNPAKVIKRINGAKLCEDLEYKEQ